MFTMLLRDVDEETIPGQVPTNDPVVKVLERADEILTKYGWIQGAEHIAHQGYCASGAIQEAQLQLKADSYTRHRAFVALEQAINEPRWQNLFRRTRHDVIGWNDDHAKNADEVHKKFRQAIEHHRKLLAAG